MDHDHLVVGSGLAALATVLALPPQARVLVAGGDLNGRFSYYDGRRTVPSAYVGHGGLGNDWHGVIPTGLLPPTGPAAASGFAALFEHFYPGASVQARLGQPWLWVPWRPIRPQPAWQALQARRGAALTLAPRLVRHLRLHDGVTQLELDDGSTHRAPRLWMAAGALHTPALLEAATGHQLARPAVSDHVLCYAGLADGLAAPQVQRAPGGMWLQAWRDAQDTALYTLRPARFEFRRLDHGIEQRAVFGLPTGSALRKIARRASPGLLVEAFFNRFGLGAQAPRHSVYAQVEVPDAYEPGPDGALRPRLAALRAATDQARAAVPFAGLLASQRPELQLPGIHLHHTLDLPALHAAGLGLPGAAVQVVDASVLQRVGCEHHSFKMMVAAAELARRETQPHP